MAEKPKSLIELKNGKLNFGRWAGKKRYRSSTAQVNLPPGKAGPFV
jgi:hypothetical protein